MYNHIMKFSEMKLCHNIYFPIHFIKHPVEIWGVLLYDKIKCIEGGILWI